ncbi:hypothetical protein CEXT_266091 [Caerostris extrusa]|uniref:C2H2-type domain-containing protein n=1 Tax=Caerostris extrusa TaxID=172846 RepID=A0AAV4TWG3_CAEEX|nr:hypothetical protein CEXT_266091 [Caerostris extrusa]
MSDDERITVRFGETFKEEEEVPALFETLRKIEIGHNIQNRLGTGNVTSSEPPADLFHCMPGPRNPISFDMGAEGVRITGASYKTDGIGDGEINSCQKISTSSAWCSRSALSSSKNSRDKKHVCDVCRKELSSLSSLGRHKKIHTGEKPFQISNIPTSSKECSSLAFSSSKNSRGHVEKHVCVDCRKEFSGLSNL